jgi:histidinol-phosphate/aromatic aminotransferase/cobyric acid decarboxylase-like protein/choline kinase
MKALILAAGLGARMRPLTNTTHKALLRVGSRTILQRIVDSLLENDVTDITIVTGYRADEIRSHIAATFPGLKVDYVHNARYAETNNIHSVALALDSMTIDSDLLLIESDLIYEPAVIKRIMAASGETVALVDRFRIGMDGTVVEVRDGAVTAVIPPHLQPSDFDFSDKYKTLNIYKLSREFCRVEFRRLLRFYRDNYDSNAYYELILGIIIYLQRHEVNAEVLNGEAWAEVDDPNDLRQARFMFEPESRLEILDESFGGFWNYRVTDFGFIRNMYFPSSAVLSEIRGNFDELARNYGSIQRYLEEKLGYLILTDPERLVVLNGASQAFPFLGRKLGGGRVLRPDPTFGEYSRVFPGAEVYRDEGDATLANLERATGAADTVVVVNPNNPTGSQIDTERLYGLAESNPDKTFLIDESFIDFADVPSIVGLLEAAPLENVVVLKSLSKSLGVPGVRLGFAYSAGQLANELRSELPIWNLNSIAENFLEVMLKHRKAIAESFDRTRHDRDLFRHGLEAIRGVAVAHPSGGNYILVELDVPAVEVTGIRQRLLDLHGMYVKDVSDRFPDGAGYLRLAVRYPDENTRLLKALADVMADGREAG